MLQDATAQPTTTTDPSIIDDYALARIEYRVRQLAIQFNLPDDRKDDLRQDMVIELIGAFRRFDPVIAEWETFVCRVLDRFVKYTYRIKGTRQRRMCANPVSFSNIKGREDFNPVGNDPRKGELSEQDRRELKADVALVISRMPKRLQRVCRVLMTFGATNSAEQLGICRGSVYRNIAKIRKHFVRAGVGFPENSATNPGQLQM